MILAEAKASSVISHPIAPSAPSILNYQTKTMKRKTNKSPAETMITSETFSLAPRDKVEGVSNYNSDYQDGSLPKPEAMFRRASDG